MRCLLYAKFSRTCFNFIGAKYQRTFYLFLIRRAIICIFAGTDDVIFYLGIIRVYACKYQNCSETTFLQRKDMIFHSPCLGKLRLSFNPLDVCPERLSVYRLKFSRMGCRIRYGNFPRWTFLLIVFAGIRRCANGYCAVSIMKWKGVSKYASSSVSFSIHRILPLHLNTEIIIRFSRWRIKRNWWQKILQENRDCWCNLSANICSEW